MCSLLVYKSSDKRYYDATIKPRSLIGWPGPTGNLPWKNREYICSASFPLLTTHGTVEIHSEPFIVPVCRFSRKRPVNLAPQCYFVPNKIIGLAGTVPTFRRTYSSAYSKSVPIPPTKKIGKSRLKSDWRYTSLSALYEKYASTYLFWCCSLIVAPGREATLPKSTTNPQDKMPSVLATLLPTYIAPGPPPVSRAMGFLSLSNGWVQLFFK